MSNERADICTEVHISEICGHQWELEIQLGQ